MTACTINIVRSKDSALLTCDYDLEGADLYSIKWYHDKKEFYRYVPKEAPPQATFVVWDIHIDLNGTTPPYKMWSLLSGQGDLRATESTLELKTSGDIRKLALRCFAAIPSIYTASAELVVAEDTPLLASITGDVSPRSSGCNQWTMIRIGNLLPFLAAVVSSRK